MSVKTTTHPTAEQRAAMGMLLESLAHASAERTAIFLGAGASKTFGYPLTRELMLDIFVGLRNGKVLGAPQDSGSGTHTLGVELHSFLGRLLPGERMSQETMPLVTGVLSLLDFALSTGQALLPGTTMEETRRMRRALEHALLAVIPEQEWWNLDNQEEKLQEQYFNEACQWLRGLVHQRPQGQVAIVTTNYDMASDFLAMHAVDVQVQGPAWNWDIDDVAKKIDYGFRWIDPETSGKENRFSRPERPAISVFKLHGSTNWLRCPLCENIYIHPNFAISQLASDRFAAAGGDAPAAEDDVSCHCSSTLLEPQIVSPSFVREMREPNLVAVWKGALDFLRDARQWIIIGYSFPDEDVAIRALFTRAYGATGAGVRPTVSVVQLGHQAKVNYESFFPPNVVNYYTGGFGLLLDCAEARRHG